MSCVTMWMTVETELTRKKSCVHLQPLDLVEKMNLSVAMDTALPSTLYVMMSMTVGTSLMKQVAIQEKEDRVLRISVNKTVPN